MKASLVWSSPSPEKTIAVAMRRCYSTKPIEGIEAELAQKGPEYWKHLLVKALQDKSLDVIEHFTMTFMLEGAKEAAAGEVARSFPYVRFLRAGPESWMVSMNARTLIEMWRNEPSRKTAEVFVSELERRKVCPDLIPLAFGERARAS
jgi:hypothetical protein